MQARRGWKEVFQVTKDKDLHPRLLHRVKLSFRMESQIKCFPDKVKLKEFDTWTKSRGRVEAREGGGFSWGGVEGWGENADNSNQITIKFKK